MKIFDPKRENGLGILHEAKLRDSIVICREI